MRVLVACEFSGAVRDAFTKRGHSAVSCDLLPSETPGEHYQGDVRDLLQAKPWDLVVAFPPCTDLSKAGARWWPVKQADGRQQTAADFFMMFVDSAPQVAIENPVGAMSRLWRKPDQIINPFQFGDPYMKATCLWLRNLPQLTPTNVVEPIGPWTDGGTYGKGKNYPRGVRNPHERSRTFRGIAEAMAEQWGVAGGA